MTFALINTRQTFRWCVLFTGLLLTMFSDSVFSHSVFSHAAWGQGSEQNTIVVVNGKSQDSRRIANEYISLRNIPATNVVVLSDVPDNEPFSVQIFREKILGPLLNQIAARRLLPQIDNIVYSTDFPGAIGVKADTDKLGKELPKIYSMTTSSITTLTYFYEYTMAGNPTYIDLVANHYYRRTMEETLSPPQLDGPDQTLNSAIQSYEGGNYQQALQKFETLANERKGTPSLLYWQARCQARLNKTTQVQTLLSQVIDAGWAFRDDTLIDPAFTTYRDESWFQELGERIPPCPPGSRPTVGFDARTRWTKDGLTTEDPKIGNRYFVTTLLAYTRNDLMSVDEAIAQIRRSANADFTHPQGTVYYMRNSDVRSKTREPGFEGAIADLQRLGIKAQKVEGVLPENVDDVIGLMMGKSQFDWPASGSTIKPGAICENLTSYGGIFFRKKDPQTRMTELIRAGAAGSSGTVAEPYAIQNKFPHPHIQVHYARGASLGEAFFQAVHGPYQLLVMGDALCRPFADRLEFTVAGIESDQVITGPVSIQVAPASSNKHGVKQVEIYVDGLLQGRHAANATIDLNSDQAKLSNGFHELRVVTIDDSPVATRHLKTIPFYVGSSDLIEIGIEDGATFNLADTITGTMKAPNATRLLLLHNMEHLADVQAPEHALNIDCQKLGRGPAKLQCVAIINGQVVLSERIEVQIK